MRTAAIAIVLFSATLAMANVFDMPSGLTSLETVLVGNAGNAGELSGASVPGGAGPDRICGAVGYTYNIGKYEVTAGQYCEFLNAVAKTDTYGLYNTGMTRPDSGSGVSRSGSSGSYAYSVNAAFVNRPVNYVSYWDACRFANWLHNGQPTGAQGAGTTETGAYTLGGYNGTDGRTIRRDPGAIWALPSEDDWYKAAYYKGGSTNAGYWDYPMSSNAAPGQDMADVSGNNANYNNYDFGSGPYPIDPPYYTTVVGEFQNSDSPYGTFDQGGNVFEWNEAIPDVSGTYNRGSRGGSFDRPFDTSLRASARYYDDPTHEFSHIGFRVVEVPEPTTLMLLALSGLAVMRRRH